MAINKYFTDTSLELFVDKIKEYADNAISTKAEIVHTHKVSDVDGLQEELDTKISIDRTINGKYLSSDIVLEASDIGADRIGAAAESLNSAKSYIEEIASDKANISHFHEISDINNLQNSLDAKVPTTRTINGKPLSDDITLTASDIWLESGSGSAEILDLAKAYTDEVGETKADLEHTHTTSDIIGLETSLETLVPINRTINNKNLTVDISLTATDVGADEIGSAANALADAKSYTDNLMTTKSDVGHTHNNIYYTESEIDAKVLNINNSITDIVDGTTMVEKANHSLSSDSATNATNSEKATMDSNGNVFGVVYETKSDATSKLGEAKTYTDNVAAGKQATITGAATTITSSNLTTNRALISNSSGKVAVSAVTSTELGYLDGVTSNVQTQLNGKASSSHTHSYAGSSSAGGAATSANKLNTSAGSSTQPVYFSNGVPVNTTYTLGKSVPSNAKFTDTTYSTATTSTNGLMSYLDKIKLDGISDKSIFAQNNEPANAPDGSLWVDLDADGAESSGGKDGMSAYTSAQAGGYTGSESQFYTDLAAMEGLAAWLAAL